MVQGAPGSGLHPDWEEPVAADWFYHILGIFKHKPFSVNKVQKKIPTSAVLVCEI